MIVSVSKNEGILVDWITQASGDGAPFCAVREILAEIGKIAEKERILLRRVIVQCTILETVLAVHRARFTRQDFTSTLA